MSQLMNYVSGVSPALSVGGWVRVGHNSGNTNQDAVWSFTVGDASMASINSVRILYYWNNTEAGTGWSGAANYICAIADANHVGIKANGVSLVGTTGSGYVDIDGLSLTPGATYYVHWNQNGTELSTMKAFQNGNQSVEVLSYTKGNTAPYWTSGAYCSIDGNSGAGIIPSTQEFVSFSWGGGADADGNTLYYDVYRVSNAGNVKLASSTTETSWTDNVLSGTEGTTYRYDIYLLDGVAFGSNNPVRSGTIAKNTKPTWNAQNVHVDGSGAPTFTPENNRFLGVSWSTANANDGAQPIYYDCYRIKPDVVLLASSITTTGIIDNIGLGNQGVEYQYRVFAHDGMEYAAVAIDSPIVTKNAMTAATLISTSQIMFDSTAIAFTWNVATNTNGNTTFTYKLSSPDITIYNAGVAVTSPYNMPVYKTGTAPSTPYVKFSDIKAKFASTSYAGSITFKLTTFNAYDSSKSTTKSIMVDLRTNPVGLGTPTTSGTYTISGTAYYIPMKKPVTINWTAATDPLGGAIVYDVLVSHNNGASYTTFKTGIAANSTTYSTNVPQVNNCLFKVIAKSARGESVTSAASTSIALYSYDGISASIYLNSRLTAEAIVSASIDIVTTIPALALSSLTYTGVSGTPIAITPVTLNPSIIETIAADDNYTFTYTIQDYAGAAIGLAAETISISVPKYVPILSIRENGVHINTANNGYGSALEVGGNVWISPDANGNNSLIVDGMVANTDGTYMLAEDGNIITKASISLTTNNTAIFGKDTGGTMRNVVGITNGNDVIFGSTALKSTFYTNGELKHYNGSATYNIWTAGNDGTGSGLDADLLDGIHLNQIFSALNPINTVDATISRDVSRYISTVQNGSGNTGFPTTYGQTWLFTGGSYGRDFSLYKDANSNNLYSGTTKSDSSKIENWDRIITQSALGSDINPFYSTGSWTPTFTGATVAGTNTYSAQTGSYVKIGKQVTVYGTLILTAKDAAMSGAVRITGLPFARNTALGYNGINIGYYNLIALGTGKTQLTGLIVGDYIGLYDNGSNINSSTVQATALVNTSRIYFSGTYETV